jgi:hypothetical protein
MNKNVRLEDIVHATLHVSTTRYGTSLLLLEGTLRGHRCRILEDSGASENFCKAEWVREHHIPTVSREKYRIKLGNGRTTTTRQRLRNEVLTIGTRTYVWTQLSHDSINSTSSSVNLGYKPLTRIYIGLLKRSATVKLAKLWCLASSAPYHWQYITWRRMRWQNWLDNIQQTSS